MTAWKDLDKFMPEDGRGIRQKRCQSVAPVHNFQCTKPRRHNRMEREITHQSGDVVWKDDGTHQHKRKLDLTPFIKSLTSITVDDELLKIDEELAGEEPVEFPVLGISDAEAELRGWWYDVADREIGQTVKKAIEYGSTDLIDIGLMLARTMKRTVNEEEAAELGIFFYLIGKLARWQSAIERGDRPSDDTLMDLGVYVRMAQRVRSAGGWPGIKEETA